MSMNIRGFSSNLYGWVERWKSDGKEPDWKELYRACAEAGLDAVEIDASPEKLALARSYGLSVSGSYIGLPLYEAYETVEASVLPFAERLAAAGGTDLVLNSDPYGGWKQPLAKPENLVKRQGDNLSRLAEKVTALGLRLSLHNHAADRYNALADLRSVVDYASLDVGLCIDTGWAHTAGCNPVAWACAYPARLAAFHLRNQRGPVPTEDLTEGEINVPALLQAAANAGYDGWLTLELWHPPMTQPVRSMTEDVHRSINYLRSMLG